MKLTTSDSVSHCGKSAKRVGTSQCRIAFSLTRVSLDTKRFEPSLPCGKRILSPLMVISSSLVLYRPVSINPLSKPFLAFRNSIWYCLILTCADNLVGKMSAELPYAFDPLPEGHCYTLILQLDPNLVGPGHRHPSGCMP